MPIANRKDLMYQVMENMTGMIRIIDVENNIIYMNKSMREEFGDSTGKKCHEMFCRNEKCETCISINSINEDSSQAKEVNYNNKVYRVIASPVNGEDKGQYSIEIFYDITEQKQLEVQSRKHYEKLKGDIEFAKQIQRKALPENGVYWNALKAYSSYYPSEDLGGDLFDIVRVNDDNVLFYIADVSGHGVRSSLLTIFLRQIIRGLKSTAANPASVIEEIIKDFKDLGLDKEQFISLIYGVYNSKTRGLSIVNAGHNCLPIVIEKSDECGERITEIDITGLPICSIISEANHEVKRLQMEKGDKILLYTDGITEAYNTKTRKELGIEGLIEIIKDVGIEDGKRLVEQITERANNFTNRTSTDDMAVLLLELM